MARNDSHGRHGGNRGSAATRLDQNPNKRTDTDVDSRREGRSEPKAGGHRPGS